MTPVPELFREAVAALQSVRPRREVLLEPMRAPQRLAPWSYAVSCEVSGPADVLASGRLVLLHDPDGQDGWDGVLRLVMYVRAELDRELATDPFLPAVGWSWLTDALDLHAPGYGAPSGTVTRVITEGYGAKSDEPPSTGFELRASWCPADDEIEDEVCGAVLAWSDVLAAAAGLPAQPPGTRALGRRGRGGRGAGAGGRRR